MKKQYTQLGSPRKPVIDNALRDLDYHAEMLSLLKLPPQQDRDAVMILHLGGVFGDKPATIARFRKNYLALPENVKARLVLENDDVSYSVHDILPICEELNIPMVLDFHHHNIVFDTDKIREGTKDIVDLFPRILQTWKRKGITPKMHYSEPTPAAITPRQRRKHNPRVATLPPCPPDTDLMIEAKDKEQAVFELMRTFKLPGFEKVNDMVPHVRKDDNKVVNTPKKKAKKKVKAEEEKDEDEEEEKREVVEDEEVGMGGPEGRVYWPPSQEHWLRPVKKVVKPKGETTPKAKNKKQQQQQKAAKDAEEEGKLMAEAVEAEVDAGVEGAAAGKKSKTKPKPKPKAKAKVKKEQEQEEEEDEEEEEEEEVKPNLALPTRKRRMPASSVGRRAGVERVRYKEEDVDEEEEEEE
ncbi:MAG: hypothetical protein Q9190_003590 [Brigantiaea leucoxantha]